MKRSFVYTKNGFEWDNEKAKRNHEKHGVAFGEVTSCFLDSQVLIDFDHAHSAAEDRLIAIAESAQKRVLVFVFTVRRKEDGEEVIRIISARRANRKERKSYWKKPD